MNLREKLIQHTTPADADSIISFIEAYPRKTPEMLWQILTGVILPPAHNFPLHAALYDICYGEGESLSPTRATSIPYPKQVAAANVTTLLQELGLADYAALHQWSINHRADFWRKTIERLGIRFQTPPSEIYNGKWLPGASMNIVESCFQSPPDATAVIESSGSDLASHSYAELRKLTARVANALVSRGLQPGAAVAAIMPLTFRAVAIYLGIIAAGGTVISIADSFAPEEIAARLRIANAQMIFTQDVIYWGDKTLPLYEKIAGAKIPIVLLPTSTSTTITTNSTLFDAFLSVDETLRPVPRSPQDAINILFSSGTTGDPKAIPWDHTTPIKCAADAHFHHDIHPGDVLCWPTNLGWMMGPWLIFAALINRATIALHAQTPTNAAFGKFVEDAKVTMLGVVPSLVRAWRQSHCMENFKWHSIRAFSSSGECSNPADMFYLSHLAGHVPIIEYCGGTEIGGGYICATVVQPSIPSTFSTPALGLDFTLLDDEQNPAEKGEAFLIGPSIGLSWRLLNRDHDEIYHRGAPNNLRRHGDELEKLPGNYFRVAGRSDDTMNLGGIKVGCAEIERVLNRLEGIHETAAVAVPPAGGGPSQLVIFAVLTDSAMTADLLLPQFQQAIRKQLNPLFHVAEVRVIAALPRTASNKIIRRALRSLIAK